MRNPPDDFAAAAAAAARARLIEDPLSAGGSAVMRITEADGVPESIVGDGEMKPEENVEDGA